MIRRIKLENYMAHKETVIDLADGLTVLIGPNNCGKSAIIHALEMICYNAEAADFAIRHGTKRAVVTLEIEENGEKHVIQWWRTKTSSGYIIDGRSISGAGRKLPDDLHKILRMPIVHSFDQKDEFFLHFGLQKSPIFLINDTGGLSAARFFASSADTAKLVEMQKRHKKKTDDTKRDRTRLDAELQQLDQQFQTLVPLDEIAGRMTGLEADYNAISAMEADRTSRAVKIASLEQAEQTERQYAHRQAALRLLGKPPELAELPPLQTCIDRLARADHDIRRNTLKIAALRDNRPAPILDEAAGLADLLRKLSAASHHHAHLESWQAACRDLREPTELLETTALEGLIARLARHETLVRSIAAASVATAALTQPAEPADLAPLSAFIARLDDAARRVQQGEQAADRARKNLKRVASEMDAWVTANPQCPTCGQPIRAELLRSGGHAHA